ncbi:APC family permease [[Mycoplasma] mobile]|uniref:Putative amino acid permease n=1 Tax=Mycoplasma mobile (strain ATCC 43663 / 163K / NCTC 11711) TaxID=267748 RepID=Q6KIH5_MYCM1|nr:amino acid permease [[Mycoplasma] mobile]AAT27601.1 putative amino acid permease [Mycoplasma mobile 163K]
MIKKIGFFTALTILVGTMVGIGIFFKNNSISTIVKGNGIAWLISWILGAIIAIFTALSYVEISTAKPKEKSGGLSYWASIFSGKKLAYLTRFNLAFFYYPIFVVVLGIFASQIFFQFLNLIAPNRFENISVWIHVIFGISISMIYFILNKISIWIAGIHQNIVTILKFIPLFVAIIVGLIFANTNNIGGSNAFNQGAFDFSRALFAIPSVLFTLDAFLIVATITHKVKGGEKTVTKVVLIGMVFVSIIYILVTIASILHNSGTVEKLIQNSLAIGFSNGIAIFVNFFIFISALGVINGMFTGFIGETENSTYSFTWFGSKILTKKFGPKKAMSFFYLFSYSFWSLIIFIPAITLNSDSIIETISNFPTLFFFLVYGLVIFFYAIKRHKTTETKKINSVLFYFISIFSMIGIVVAIFSQFIVLIIDASTLPNIEGAFGTIGIKLTNLQLMITTIIFIILFFLLPYINFLLIKYFEENLQKKSTIKTTKMDKSKKTLQENF